ncbi:MAG: hypothetical protein V3V84_00650 [Candidatus Bathyarchaeia archaeon]
MNRTYYLLFKDADTWFAKFLKPRFTHVEVYWAYGPDIYIGVNAGKILSIITKKQLVFRANMPVLKVTINPAEIKASVIPTRWGLFCCTTVAKFMLGIRSFAFTPYQLFKFLVKYQNRLDSKNKQIVKIEVL